MAESAERPHFAQCSACGVGVVRQVLATHPHTDPVGHPVSIHNWLEVWDYSSHWATHASIQRGDALSSPVRTWRRRWRKPIVAGELGYEGDLDQGWGFLTTWNMTIDTLPGTHSGTVQVDLPGPALRRNPGAEGLTQCRSAGIGSVDPRRTR